MTDKETHTTNSTVEKKEEKENSDLKEKLKQNKTHSEIISALDEIACEGRICSDCCHDGDCAFQKLRRKLGLEVRK